MYSTALSPFLLIAFVVGIGSLLVQTGLPDPGTEILAGKAQVIDGDTLEVAGQRVRLAGIDAPEHRQFCRFPVLGRYPCGQIAAQLLTQQLMVVSAGRASCTIRGRVGHGRALGVCRDANGTDLGGWVVAQGWALAERRSATT